MSQSTAQPPAIRPQSVIPASAVAETSAPAPQLIQVQLPPQVSPPSAYTPTVQGDIGTFLVLIALSVLVKLLSDKP